MMDCKQLDELLMDYIYQELSPSQAELVEAHLSGCPRCAEAVSAFERTRTAMRALPELEPPTGMDDLLKREALKAVQSVQPERASFGERLRAWLRPLVLHPAMTAAATLVVVLGISFYMYREGEPTTSRTEADRPPPLGTPAAAPTAAGAPGKSGAFDERLAKGAATVQGARGPVEEQETERKVGERQAIDTVEKATGEKEAPRERAAHARGELSKLGGELSKDREDAPALEPPAATPPKGWTGKLAQGEDNSVADDVGLRANAPLKVKPAAAPVEPASSGRVAQTAPSSSAQVPRGGASEGRAGDPEEKVRKQEWSGGKSAGMGQGGVGTKRDQLDDVGTAGDTTKLKQMPNAKEVRVASDDKSAREPGSSQVFKKGRAATARARRSSKSPSSFADVGSGAQQVQSKAQPSALQYREMGDKLAAAGKCDEALSYYSLALRTDPGLRKAVEPRVMSCGAMLASAGESRIARAQKANPQFAGLLEAQMARRRLANEVMARKASKAKNAGVDNASQNAAKSAPAKAPQNAKPAAGY